MYQITRPRRPRKKTPKANQRSGPEMKEYIVVTPE
jgi:hypothetical protein